MLQFLVKRLVKEGCNHAAQKPGLSLGEHLQFFVRGIFVQHRRCPSCPALCSEQCGSTADSFAAGAAVVRVMDS